MNPHFSARKLHKLFCEGELQAEDIVDGFLNRIHTYEPKIRSFLHLLSARAKEKAIELDHKRKQGQPLGRLAGIPIALKDNIHVCGEKTTCGSRFLQNYTAVFSASVVERLEKEDAIIIGKTNLDEFAMGSSTENSAFHRTKNPWNTDLSPGGSSGGSAAAVAARFCPIALGSDTGGSIRQPASFCGIVGFKPTYGRVSRQGLVAYGSSLDQIGPLAHSVSDAALVMEVIGHHCDKDATSLFEPPDLYLSDRKKDLRGIKIGVPRAFVEQMDEEFYHLFQANLEQFTDLGASVHNISIPTLSHSLAIYYIIATAEASTNLARYDGIGFSRRSSHAESLQDIYAYSKEEGFGAEVKQRILLGTYVLSAGYREAYYQQAQKARSRLIHEFSESFSHCHLIALPTTPTTAFGFDTHKSPLEMYLEDIFTMAANLAGLPAVSIPGGFKNGLPFGLQLMGPQKGDVSVLGAAYTFEQAYPSFFKAPEVSA